MCRFAFATGSEQPLSALLYDAPHSLEEQAYRPREQQHGNVNVDGTGVVWWRDDDRPPLRYVTASPPWSDANLPSLAAGLEARTMLAAVRGATPGVGFGSDLVAPFLLGGLAFAHNGWIGGFRTGVGAELLGRLPPDRLSTMAGFSDSTVIFLSILAHRAAGAALPEAVTAALCDVADACRRAGEDATMNVIVTDGTETVATRSSLGLPGNSLHLGTNLSRWPGAVLLASEPLDDGPWTPVAEDSLVHLTGTDVRRCDLALEPHP